jgi:GAF domain-containing protein
VEQDLFGVLVLYAPDRNFFDEEELKLLKELAGDISFALDFIAKDEKVDYLAYYDTLTGLPNRKLFFDAFQTPAGRSRKRRPESSAATYWTSIAFA